MTLIYTALLCEAQSLIEKYRLTQIDNNPKTYQNKELLVVIGGVGGINTTNTLETIYKRYTIEKGINIGIAGCGDREVKLGEVFCTNQKLENIRYKELKTVHNPQTTLVILNLFMIWRGVIFWKFHKSILKMRIFLYSKLFQTTLMIQFYQKIK